MKLGEALDQIGTLDDELVIFAVSPWSIDSLALIDWLDGDFKVPKHISDQGFEYFLEVSLAREVLAVAEGSKLLPEQKRALLLLYAENDAYPDWLYA